MRIYTHCMGACVISVQFFIDLYHGDRFVTATNQKSKCVHRSQEAAKYHLICWKLVLLSANLQSQNNLQIEGRVSSKFSDMLQSVEIALFMRTKRRPLLRGSSSKH